MYHYLLTDTSAVVITLMLMSIKLTVGSPSYHWQIEVQYGLVTSLLHMPYSL